MRYLVLALILSLAACSHSPPVNRAVRFTTTVTDDAMTCLAIPKHKEPGKADAAICEADFAGTKINYVCFKL